VATQSADEALAAGRQGNQGVPEAKRQELQEVILVQLASGPKSRPYLDEIAKELGLSPDQNWRYGLTPLKEQAVRPAAPFRLLWSRASTSRETA
jgi:hypothetical protein